MVAADRRGEADGGDEHNAREPTTRSGRLPAANATATAADGHRSDGVAAGKRSRVAGRRLAIDDRLQGRDEGRRNERGDEERA